MESVFVYYKENQWYTHLPSKCKALSSNPVLPSTLKNRKPEMDTMAHTCNPSYSGSGDQEDQVQSGQNVSETPFNHKKWMGGEAQIGGSQSRLARA
jgi:hypothetical protein